MIRGYNITVVFSGCQYLFLIPYYRATIASNNCANIVLILP